MSGLRRLRTLAPRLPTLHRLVSRAYGSAAAQLQYDSDYYEEEEEELRHGMVGTDGWVPGRGVQWVIIGHRGGQRHMYAERLSKLLQVPHISMGSLVRQELHPRSSLYKQVPYPLLFFSNKFYVFPCSFIGRFSFLRICFNWDMNHENFKIEACILF